MMRTICKAFALAAMKKSTIGKVLMVDFDYKYGAY